MPTAGRPARRPARALLLTGPLLGACSQPAGETLTTAADEHCVATARPAPGFWAGDDGGLEGVVAERLDLGGLRVVDVPLSELAAGGPDGCDMALAQLAPTDERRDVASWGSAYLRADQCIVVAGDLEVSDVQTARGCAAERSSGSAGALRDAVPTADVRDAVPTADVRDAVPTADVRDFPDFDELLEAVECGEVDAAVLDLPVALVATDRPALRVLARFARSDQYAVEVRDAGQRDALDRALRSLVAQSVLDELVERWLEPRYAQELDAVPALRTENQL